MAASPLVELAAEELELEAIELLDDEPATDEELAIDDELSSEEDELAMDELELAIEDDEDELLAPEYAIGNSGLP